MSLVYAYLSWLSSYGEPKWRKRVKNAIFQPAGQKINTAATYETLYSLSDRFGIVSSGICVEFRKQQHLSIAESYVPRRASVGY
jgi:predicted AAA+ superfamily ATPase